MFEKFGEMSSCREINELAENLLNEGDIQSLKVMAQENGIPEDYVEMYQSGDIPYLCDTVTAAMGKLDVECGSLKLAGLMNDWVEYIRGLCMEDEMVAHQVRKKGNSEEYGLKVYLCHDHHIYGPEAVHNNARIRHELQRTAQRLFEKQHSHKEFMEIFGRNYLDPVEIGENSEKENEPV